MRSGTSSCGRSATRRIGFRGSAAVGLVLLLSLGSAGERAPYQVHFGNSCTPAVQADFARAITQLHSFEYGESSRLFTGIIDREPGCAMAYWGAAMSLWHPLWAPPASADLEAGAKLLGATSGLAVTPREAVYIDALRAYFANDDAAKNAARAKAYEQRMSAVYANNLDDPEAAVFYALALLATQDPHDRTYAQPYKAATLLTWVRTMQPDHPGALHYLIHACDYPGMAHLGLEAATLYAAVARDSAHAQHMPSHIFTRLGLWDQAIASNHDSTRSAADYTERAHLAGHYDEGLHSMDYLMYALLQAGRDVEARALLDSLDRIERTNVDTFKVAYTYAASPARYALERRAWDEASNLPLGHPGFPWQEYGWARSISYFARGIGAARSGKSAQSMQEVAHIKALQAALPATTLPYWREEVQVHIDVVTAWARLAEGKRDEALHLALLAADREDAVDKHPVTPGEVLPARELYADMLRETGASDRALAEYETVLKGSPNRLNALIGAAAAAQATGDAARAARYRAAITGQTRGGNLLRDGLAGLAAGE